MTDEPVTVAGTVARRVQEVRERRRYSLQELSRRVRGLGHRLDGSAVMRLERGERRPTVEDVLALAVALDVSPDALVLPLDERAEVAVTPRVVRRAGGVRGWFGGRWPLTHAGAADIASITRAHLAWQSERPLWEQRARAAAPGVVTLLHEAYRYAITTGDDPADVAERRRALRALRAEVDRQLETLDGEG